MFSGLGGGVGDRFSGRRALDDRFDDPGRLTSRLSAGILRGISDRRSYGDRLDDRFFPTLIGGGPSFVKSLSGGVNTRAAWEEAEIFLFNKLRSGMHSDEIEERVRQELSRTFQSGYRYAFLRAILSQLVKLRGSRTIRDMPSMSVQLQMARVDHLRFLLGLRNRFTDITSFRCYTVDDEATREFARTRALDREAEEELRFLRQREHSQMEEQYRANEEALQAELADAKLRAEAAETRFEMEAKQNRDLGQAGLPRNPGGMSEGRRVPSSNCGSRSIDFNGGRNNQNRGADDMRSRSSRNASSRGASLDRRSHRSRSERTNRPDNNSRDGRYQPNGQRFPRDLPAQFPPQQGRRGFPPQPYDRFGLGGGMYDRMGMDPRMSMGPRMDPRVGPMGMDPRDSLGFDRLSLHRGSQPQQGYAETVRTDQYTRSKEGYPPQTQQDRPRKKYDDLRAMGIIIIGGDDTDNGRA